MRRFLICGFVAAACLLAVPVSGFGGNGEGVDRSSSAPIVEAARHVGDYREGRVSWKSTFVLEPWTDRSIDRFAFATSLPSSTRLESSGNADVELRRDETGRVSGVRTDSDDRIEELELTLTVPWQPGAGRPLPAPLAGGDALQRIDLQGVRYQPADESGLTRYPGYVAHRDIGGDPGRRFELEPEPGIGESEQVIYVRGDRLPEGRVEGSFERSSTIKRRSSWILVGVLAVLAVVGVAGWRLLEAPAREEEAEAILAEHDDSFRFD